MLTGAHVRIYSTDPEADRAFLRDALELPFVDARDGWLIFALPPGEAAIHPAQDGGSHELFFICDHIDRFIERMKGKGIPCEPVHEQSWGLLTYLHLPGGSQLGIYEPRHKRPVSPEDV